MKLSFSSSQRNFLALLLIILAVGVCFSPVLQGGFIQWGDNVQLLDNAAVRSLKGSHLKDLFQDTQTIYTPLTTLTFAVQYHFFGFDPFVYHLTNFILHIIITLLIFGLARQLKLSMAGAFFTALIFGVHPIHVESVAWIAEQKTLVYAVFYVLAMMCYVRYLQYTEQQKATSIIGTRGYFVLANVLGVLSMLASPMALSLPLIFFTLDWFKKRELTAPVIWEKIPLMLMLWGLFGFTSFKFMQLPLVAWQEAALIWPWTFVFYLRQFLFPYVSVPIYPIPTPIEISQFEFAISLMTLVLIVIALVRSSHRRWFTFAMGFYFCSIFFLLRFAQAPIGTNMVADRFIYLGSLGFCLLLGMSFNYVSQLLQEKKAKLKHKLTYGILVVLVSVFGVFTFNQTKVWQNDISLWHHQLRFYPDEPIALSNLATALRHQRDFVQSQEEYRKVLAIKAEGLDVNLTDEVKAHVQNVGFLVQLYGRAIKASPFYVDAYYNWAELSRDIGRTAEAIALYQTTIKLSPQHFEAYVALGNVLVELQASDKAIVVYQKALKIDPENEDNFLKIISVYNQILQQDPENLTYLKASREAFDQFTDLINRKQSGAESFFNLGFLYGETGQLDRAISAYQMALDTNPNHAKSLYNLGNLYKNAGRLNEALAMYAKATTSDSKFSDAFLNMGIIYASQGDTQLAEEHYKKAIKADPKNGKAYFNLAYLIESSGNIKEAIVRYIRAIEVDGQNAEGPYNLGNAYISLEQYTKALESYQQAIKINPNHLNAHINLSVLAYQQDQYDLAIKHLDEAILLGYQAPPEFVKALAPYRSSPTN